jgi:phage terminase Nu1 subunit (DNA packaging protein)
MSAPSPSPDAATQTERRVHHKVREVFTEACALIAPSLGRGETAAASAASILRQRYPELSALEIHVLVTAAARAYAQRGGA